VLKPPWPGSTPLAGSCGSPWSVAIGSLASNVITATLRSRGPAGQVRPGPDERSLNAPPAAGAILGGQEAGSGRRAAGGLRVDRLEGFEHLPARRVQPQLDLHLERLPVLGHVPRLVWIVPAAAGMADLGIAETDPVSSKVSQSRFGSSGS